MNLVKMTVIGFFMFFVGTMGAHATTIDVYAAGNSSTGGGGAVTGINIGIGDHLVMTTDVNDCWSAGPSPRESNADGLVGTGGTCQPTAAFGNWTQAGVSAPYGTLMGKIGSGAFFVVGTFFDQIMAEAGALALYYWDSNSGDNSGYVTVSISQNPNTGQNIPEPGILGLLGLGLGLLLFRRRV
ncbi:MAG: PEP-CTERM sorting domain-containing protein [Emcibacter sp.]|nr:PEP-CTERM sorting domain-containing protein [Emcibacter sp.]